MQEEIELTESEKHEIESTSANVFEMEKRIQEALKKKRAERKKKTVVVPQVFTYQGSSGFSTSSTGVYNGQLGSSFMR